MTDLNLTQPHKKFKILLLGDSCEDQYCYGTVDRISPEAPVPVLKTTKTISLPGMAANVEANLKALGCEVYFITNTERLVKTRYIDERSEYQLIRIDEESKIQSWSGNMAVDPKDFDAIVISDYNKGFLLYDHIEKLIQNSIPVFIDTKKTDLAKFEGAFVKINNLEFEKSTSVCTNLIVTKGSQGALYKDRLYPAPKVEVFDVTGAGDTFLSALAYQYLNTNDIERAIVFANVAGSITVKRNGVYAPTLKEIYGTESQSS